MQSLIDTGGLAKSGRTKPKKIEKISNIKLALNIDIKNFTKHNIILIVAMF
jgi:hypothetical protein